MNKIINLTGLLILALLFSCANVEKDWEKTNKKNTVLAFEKFIEKYPESSLIGQANLKILSLKSDSIYTEIFNKSLRKTEINGELQVLLVDGGFRDNSMQFSSIRYIEHNDTIWVIHFNPNAYFSRTVSLGEEYRLVGSFLYEVDTKPNPAFLERLDAIPDVFSELFSDLSPSEQNFMSSDSLNELYNYRDKFSPDKYQTLCEIYLLNQEYIFLNNYMDCISDRETSIGGKKTMSVLVDTLTLVSSVQEMDDDMKDNKAVNNYTFNESKPLDLAENGKREEVNITSSGLQYEIIKEGNGVKPNETSTVTVNYEGLLVNGVVFDSSYERGEPTTFSLNKVIQGWQEGLQLMSVGSKYVLYIPSNLAYGSEAVGSIPASANLVYTVELIEVEE